MHRECIGIRQGVRNYVFQIMSMILGESLLESPRFWNQESQVLKLFCKLPYIINLLPYLVAGITANCRIKLKFQKIQTQFSLHNL